MKNIDSKEKIFQAARTEFAKLGYGGARMDKIAAAAGINKAMLHYYFSSKRNLYNEVVRDVLGRYFTKIGALVQGDTTAENFLAAAPRIIIQFFSENQDFQKIIMWEMMNPDFDFADLFKENFAFFNFQGPTFIRAKIKSWHKQGIITESDPVQFMLNLLGIIFITFIGKKMVMTIFGESEEDENYLEQRIESIVNLLKNGMLK